MVAPRRVKRENVSFPVAVRRSKMPLLKLPIIRLENKHWNFSGASTKIFQSHPYVPDAKSKLERGGVMFVVSFGGLDRCSNPSA